MFPPGRCFHLVATLPKLDRPSVFRLDDQFELIPAAACGRLPYMSGVSGFPLTTQHLNVVVVWLDNSHFSKFS
jgi:hypothetical protein